MGGLGPLPPIPTPLIGCHWPVARPKTCLNGNECDLSKVRLDRCRKAHGSSNTTNVIDSTLTHKSTIRQLHHSIIPQFDYSTTLPFHQSTILRIDNYINPLFNDSTSPPIHRSIIQRFVDSIILPFNDSKNPQFDDSTTPPFHPLFVDSTIRQIRHFTILWFDNSMISSTLPFHHSTIWQLHHSTTPLKGPLFNNSTLPSFRH